MVKCFWFVCLLLIIEKSIAGDIESPISPIGPSTRATSIILHQSTTYFTDCPTKKEAKMVLSNLLAEESCEVPILPEHLEKALTNIFGRPNNQRQELCEFLARQLKDCDYASQLIRLHSFSERPCRN